MAVEINVWVENKYFFVNFTREKQVSCNFLTFVDSYDDSHRVLTRLSLSLQQLIAAQSTDN